MATAAEIKASIDANITDKVAFRSIDNTDVGADIKSVVDYVDQEITATEELITSLEETLSTVATTGEYDDLLNTPVQITKTSDILNDGTNGLSTYVETSEISIVATTGDYNDLINTPDVPRVFTQGTIGSVTTNVTPYDITPYDITIITAPAYSQVSLPTTNLYVGKEFYIQTISIMNLYANPLNNGSSTIFVVGGGSSSSMLTDAGGFYKFTYLGVLDTYSPNARWIYQKLNQ
jgi:hypothetical protein